jgi:ribosomal protein S18 acetylase RimI-like enzyme
MEIALIKKFKKEVHESINELLPQLSRSAAPVSESDLREIIDSDSSQLLMAVESGRYLGCLTLVIFKLPTGKRAWIEDVVVREDARGKGVGKLLIKKAIELASVYGAKTVDLTSRPSREAANKLYKTMGFEARQTNVYRYKGTY